MVVPALVQEFAHAPQIGVVQHAPHVCVIFSVVEHWSLLILTRTIQTEFSAFLAVCSPVCSNGGTCNAGNTCTCPSTWTGTRCTTRTYQPYLSEKCSSFN